MGGFFTNYQVRTSDHTGCIKALKSTIRSRAMVTEALNGWVTVYDETSESQDLEELRRVGQAISKKLKASVFCFMVHDSDIFVYLLYENGKFVDQFDSRPDYFGPVTDEQKEEWAGHFDKLLKLAKKGTKAESIAKVLKKSQPSEDHRAVEFAQLFGIDPQRAREGFKYAEEEKRDYRTVLARGQKANDAKLLEALNKRNFAAVIGLLKEGASPNALDRFGAPILLHAIRCKANDVVVALVEAGADVLAEGKHAGDAIWLASAEGQDETLEKLLNKSKGDKRLKKSLEVGLRASTLGGHVDSIRLLLSAGADINSQDEAGQTMLMLAAVRGREAAYEITTGRDYPVRPGERRPDWPRVVETLVKAGADLNVEHKDGGTALVLAAARGTVEMCRVIVDAGADLNRQTKDGMTALLASITRGNIEICRLLIEAKADLNLQTKEGVTALIAAAWRGNLEICRLLVDAGADVEIKLSKGVNALAIAKSRGHQAIVDLLLPLGGSAH